jgi:hypothetical protein
VLAVVAVCVTIEVTVTGFSVVVMVQVVLTVVGLVMVQVVETVVGLHFTLQLLGQRVILGVVTVREVEVDVVIVAEVVGDMVEVFEVAEVAKVVEAVEVVEGEVVGDMIVIVVGDERLPQEPAAVI